MEFKGLVNTPQIIEGAAICILRQDYEGGPHFTIQANSVFPLFFEGGVHSKLSAKVVMFHEQKVVLELSDLSRWLIKRIPTHASFEIGAGASASLWEVEGVVDAAVMDQRELEETVLVHLQAEPHCGGVTRISLYGVTDANWPYNWKAMGPQGEVGDQAFLERMANVYKKLGKIRLQR